ncbi:MAG TPA: hypothetical protein VMX33_10520 [bacterium]|nr:hypothetical protein [bacterium]
MKTIVRRALFAALVLAAMALSSCAEGPTGIFASVAAETPVNKNMTPAIEYASPTFVARLGTTWYSGMGVLWQKADGATQWTKASVSLPGISASDTLFADSGAVVSGTPDTLYVAFRDVTLANSPSLGVYSTADGTTWTQVEATFPVATEYLRSIMVANGQLFAVTTNVRADSATAAAYSIYYLSGTFQSAGIVADTTIGVPTSVAWDGTNYIFTAGDSLITGTASLLSVLPTTTGIAYSGVCSDGSTGIIISSRNGYLYRSTDSGATLSLPAGPFKNSLGKTYSFSAPTYIGAAPDPILVVGTNRIPRTSSDIPPAGGYLEFDATNFATTFASSTPTTDHGLTASAVNFDTSLDARSVSGMPMFDTGGGTFKLFAMTDGYGLWSDTYSGTTDHANGWDWWVRE